MKKTYKILLTVEAEEKDKGKILDVANAVRDEFGLIDEAAIAEVGEGYPKQLLSLHLPKSVRNEINDQHYLPQKIDIILEHLKGVEFNSKDMQQIIGYISGKKPKISAVSTALKRISDEQQIPKRRVGQDWFYNCPLGI